MAEPGNPELARRVQHRSVQHGGLVSPYHFQDWQSARLNPGLNGYTERVIADLQGYVQDFMRPEGILVTHSFNPYRSFDIAVRLSFVDLRSEPFRWPWQSPPPQDLLELLKPEVREPFYTPHPTRDFDIRMSPLPDKVGPFTPNNQGETAYALDDLQWGRFPLYKRPDDVIRESDDPDRAIFRLQLTALDVEQRVKIEDTDRQRHTVAASIQRTREHLAALEKQHTQLHSAQTEAMVRQWIAQEQELLQRPDPFKALRRQFGVQ